MCDEISRFAIREEQAVPVDDKGKLGMLLTLFTRTHSKRISHAEAGIDKAADDGDINGKPTTRKMHGEVDAAMRSISCVPSSASHGAPSGRMRGTQSSAAGTSPPRLCR